MQIDPAFRNQARSARRRSARRRLLFWGKIGGIVIGLAGGAIWLFQPHFVAQDDDMVMVQSDDQPMIAPPVLGDAFADIAGDPMVIGMDDDDRDAGVLLAGPAGLDPARVGPVSDDRLTLFQENLYGIDRRLIAALPTTREDFALFKAQRNLAARTEAAQAADMPARSANTPDASSFVYLRDSDLRVPAWRELLLQVQVAAPLADLLIANDFPAAEAGRIADAAKGFSPEQLKKGTIVALRYAGQAQARRLVQMSLYDDGALAGAVARADASGDENAVIVPASDAWFDEDILSLADDVDAGRLRLLDVMYSAALRGGLPVESVGEVIAMMAQVHDLDAYAAPGDRLVMAYANDGAAGGTVGRILYAGITGPSGTRPCYVVADDSDGWRCHAPGARVVASQVGLSMLMPVAARASGRYSAADPWLSWREGQAGAVIAPAAGRVAGIEQGDNGLGLTLQHQGNVTTRLQGLAHLAEGIAKDVDIRAGQVLGEGGGWGGIRLQVLRDGEPVDPMPYLTGTEAVLASDAVESLIARIIMVESAGQARAQNPRSSATGLGQFIDSTWLRMMGSYRPDLVASLTRQEVLDLRFDPALSREMVRHLAQENEAFLRARGHAVTSGRLYLAHFLGPGGADRVLTSDPAASVGVVLGQAVVRANPFLANYSVADLRGWADRKMAGHSGPLPDTLAAEPVSPEVARFVQLVDSVLQGG